MWAASLSRLHSVQAVKVSLGPHTCTELWLAIPSALQLIETCDQGEAFMPCASDRQGVERLIGR